MAIQQILQYPDPRLRNKAVPVDVVDETIGRLVDDLLETMYAAPGIGLAATQINVHQRVLVTDISELRRSPLCLINPVLLKMEGTVEMDEGCLSVPDVFEAVQRAESIKVRALDREGKAFELEATGLLAVCIQHEMDHLDGRLFVDYLSQLKRNRIRKRLEKEQKQVL